MSNINSLDLLLSARNKQAVVAAPGGKPQFMPPPGMPMDPSMMPPGMPMDPSMMPPGMPMDPAMMPPPAPAMNIEQEITDIKEMLQALMESQIALMQTIGGGMPPMPPGMPMDPSMMPPPSIPPMSPPGMPSIPSGGMQVTANHKEAQDKDFANYMRTIADLLR